MSKFQTISKYKNVVQRSMTRKIWTWSRNCSTVGVEEISNQAAVMVTDITMISPQLNGSVSLMTGSWKTLPAIIIQLRGIWHLQKPASTCLKKGVQADAYP